MYPRRDTRFINNIMKTGRWTSVVIDGVIIARSETGLNMNLRWKFARVRTDRNNRRDANLEHARVPSRAFPARDFSSYYAYNGDSLESPLIIGPPLADLNSSRYANIAMYARCVEKHEKTRRRVKNNDGFLYLYSPFVPTSNSSFSPRGFVRNKRIHSNGFEIERTGIDRSFYALNVSSGDFELGNRFSYRSTR